MQSEMPSMPGPGNKPGLSTSNNIIYILVTVCSQGCRVCLVQVLNHSHKINQKAEKNNIIQALKYR